MQDVILITGGAGFIGCAVAKGLGGFNQKIVAVDNMHPQIHRSPERPAALPADVDLIVGDVCDDVFWDGFLAEYRPSVILHFAAETGTAQSLTESTRHAMVNVVGTTQMLDALGRAKILPGHIVLSSSRAIYGEGAWQGSQGERFYPDLRSHAQLSAKNWDLMQDGQRGRPLPHRASDTNANPSSIYGATKLTQEHILKSWCAAMHVPVSILRFQNVYGPGQSPFNPYTGIINLFHRTAYAGGTIEVYEDGQIGRDFVFIDDVADAVVAAIHMPPTVIRTLDVGSGVPTTILEAARHIAELHGAPEPVICGKFRDGDIRWAVADVQDLEADLGVQAKVDFLKEGAKLVGEWLIDKGYMA